MPLRDGTALDVLSERLARGAARAGHRGVLLLEPAGLGALPGLDRWARSRFVDGAVEAPRADARHRLQRLLGSERSRLYLRVGGPGRAQVDAHDAGLLAAALGTVRGGGIAVVARLPGASTPSPLVRRALAGIEREARRGTPGFAVARLGVDFDAGVRGRPPRIAARASDPGDGFAASAAAMRAHDALLDRAARALVPTGATLVVRGARGRGKSALLGRLHDHLADALPPHPPMLVAAPGSPTHGVERHAARPVHRLSPEAALRALPGTLLVDEAASLPVRTLAALLERHDRVALATTVDGHETAGRAFAVRLDAVLGTRAADATVLEPVVPMRWREADPLERLLRRALLLDAREAVNAAEVATTRRAALATGLPPADGPAAARTGAPVETVRLRARRLNHDETTLRDVASLLMATHYQNAFHDLEHALAGRLDVWAARSCGELAGVAFVAREGGIDVRLADAIIAGRRRLPDQLLPQLLARAASDGSALGARYARIVRIAVAPAARRRGVGSALLRCVEAADGTGLLATGASFAADGAVMAFWETNGYRTFHAGSRINPRSGTVSCAVMRAGPARSITPEPAPDPFAMPAGDARRGAAIDLVHRLARRPERDAPNCNSRTVVRLRAAAR